MTADPTPDLGLVQKLKIDGSVNNRPLSSAAADYIERLQAAHRRIIEIAGPYHPDRSSYQRFADVSREALSDDR